MSVQRDRDWVTVYYRDKEVRVRKGENLRRALIKSGLSPYNDRARSLNCYGAGTCGTCAVKVDGRLTRKTEIEKWRLNFPPHKPEGGLRLACQCRVLSDVKVIKYKGFWGQRLVKSRSGE